MESLLPHGLVAGTDECDSAICALLALGFAAGDIESSLPRLAGPGDGDLTSAETEGWIFYPDL